MLVFKARHIQIQPWNIGLYRVSERNFFSRTCTVARISLRGKREHPNKQRQRRPKVTKGCPVELHKHKTECQTKNQRKPAPTTQETNYMNELSDDRVEYLARNHKAASCRISKHSSRASLASFLKVRALRSFQSTHQVSMTSESKPFLLPRGTLRLAQVHQRKGSTSPWAATAVSPSLDRSMSQTWRLRTQPSRIWSRVLEAWLISITWLLYYLSNDEQDSGLDLALFHSFACWLVDYSFF